MTLGNTYHRPRLFIQDKEIHTKISGSITFAGNSQLNSLQVSIADPNFQNSRLFNAKVEFYLNNGSEDTIPIFRGFIRSASPSSKGVSITAYDPRIFLKSNDALKITITDSNNFDGYSLAAFLNEFITNNINDNETIIGLDAIRDTNPIVTMTGIRGTDTAYNFVLNKLKQSIDSSDIENPLTYFIDIIEDSNYSSLTFKKDKQLTSVPSYSFSFNDGIKDLKFSRRAPVTVGIYDGGKFVYGNAPQGKIGTVISGNFDSKADKRNEAIKQVLLKYQDTNEISVDVNKGFYVGLGSIINIHVDEEDVDGNHRVVSKNISFGDSLTCSLKLGRKPIKISDYISAA